jgi:hypothetical protein
MNRKHYLPRCQLLDDRELNMGQRANLVIVENGDWNLYYDHWCANRLDVELFWGPVLARQFIEQRPPLDDRGDWLDEVWCEGGAVVDCDRKTLTWFGGEDVKYEIPARRALLELMKRPWTGWEVKWAWGGVAEIGAYLGIAPDIFLSGRNREAWKQIRVLTEYPEDNRMLLTVRIGNRTSVGRVFGEEEALEFGFGQLAAIPAMAGAAFLIWEGDMPTMGAHVDLDNRELSYWCARPCVDIERRVQRGWPGWQTHWLRDRFEEHLRLASIDIRLPGKHNKDLQIEAIHSLRRCAHHAAENPARECFQTLRPLGASSLNFWTDEVRGSVGSHSDKMRLLDSLEEAIQSS